MNKILIWIFVSLILISSASADYVFKQNDLIDLKVPCIDSNYNYCDSTTKCNITIQYPNQSSLISNQDMTRTAVYYNYTIQENTISSLGEYPAQVQCMGVNSGYTSFDFLVTYNGKELPSDFIKVLFILLFIALISTLLYTILLLLIHFVKWDADLIDVAYFVGIYFAIFCLKYFNMEYMGSYIIDTFSDLLIEVGAFTHVVLPLIAFIISYIKRKMEFKKEDEL